MGKQEFSRKIGFSFWCNPKRNYRIDTCIFHEMFILEFSIQYTP